MLAEKIKQNQGAQVINMPKKESYTQVPNDIMDKLYSKGFHLPGEQGAVFNFILRKTIGWGKDNDRLSLSQFASALGIKKQSADRAIKALTTRKIITVSKDADSQVKVFGINTNIDEWKPSAKMLPSATTLKTVSNAADKPSAKMLNTKDNKETITKEIKNLSPHSAEADKPEPEIQPSAKIKKLSHLSQAQAAKFKVFWESYPKHRRKEKPKAENAFKAINPDEILFAEIMAGLEASINSHDWQKDNGQFVCYPERFLKNQKWTDEHDIGRGFKKSSCPMTNYMPPKDLAAEAEKYSRLLSEPEF